MATKYFSGDIELGRATSIPNAEFAARFPGVKGRHDDGYHMLVGNPADFVATFDREAGRWRDDYRPVDRIVNYKDRPSRHICDARCMNARGRTMNCECACGGKNHGNGGKFTATAA